MVSWCDPELIPKGEWDSEFAEPIMAGRLPSNNILYLLPGGQAGRQLFGASLHRRASARAIRTVCLQCAAVMSTIPSAPCSAVSCRAAAGCDCRRNKENEPAAGAVPRPDQRVSNQTLRCCPRCLCGMPARAHLLCLPRRTLPCWVRA